MPLTRLDALRALLAAPLDSADQQRIGHAYRDPAADARVRLTYVVRVIRTVLRRVS